MYEGARMSSRPNGIEAVEWDSKLVGMLIGVNREIVVTDVPVTNTR